MKLHIKTFCVREGEKVKLKKWPTRVHAFYHSKQHYKEMLDEHVGRLSALQRLLYAHNR